MKSAAHQYEDKLLEFAYGELPQHEADAVDAHVRGCSKCAEALDEIRGVRATMAHLPMEAAPDAGLDSLLAYAEQAAKRNAEAAKPAPSFFRRFLMPLASLAALLTVGIVSFRANQEFDTSPAAVLAEKKVEEYERAEKNKGKADLAPKDALAAAPTPAAAPVAAAQPRGNVEQAKSEPMPDPEGGGLAQELADDRKEWGGKRGFVQDKLEAKKPSAPPPQSVTRRAQKSKMVPAEEPLRDANDYSNAMGRGALEREAKPVEPVKEEASNKPAAGDKGGLFGLSGGGASSGIGSVGTGTLGTGTGPAPMTKSAPSPKPAPKKSAEADEKKTLSSFESSDDSYAEAEAPTQRRADVAPAPTAPPPPPTSAPPSKSSYGLRPMTSNSTPSTADEDQAVLERLDAVGLDNQAKFEERQKQQSAQTSRTRSLDSAREAAKKGDRSSEIRFALQTLENGATGSQRAEALKRLCDGYEALGQHVTADPYCDQLVSEFPTSSYAQAVTQRRGAVQRATPSSVPAKAAPAERKATEAAPASAY